MLKTNEKFLKDLWFSKATNIMGVYLRKLCFLLPGFNLFNQYIALTWILDNTGISAQAIGGPHFPCLHTRDPDTHPPVTTPREERDKKYGL